jgi:alkylation response protein AidB-like acyl-CoA dehydrogenase
LELHLALCSLLLASWSCVVDNALTRTEAGDYEAFRANVQRLADTRIRPFAAAVDDEERFPKESREAFCTLELPGLAFPSDLGGGDGDLMAQVIAVEEIAKVCASSALVLLIPWAALTPLVRFGSEELKRRIVPDVASGKSLASFCLTEPGGGSDLPSLKSKASRTNDGWVISGHKRFISNVGWSEWYAVLARTAEKGFGVFLIHRDDPGVSFGKPERKMGTRGCPTGDVLLDQCTIPLDRVIGDPNEGYTYMMETLSYTRPLIAAHALGIAQGALDAAITYTSQRTQFETVVSRFQIIRGMVADMTTRVEAGRSLLYRAVEEARANDDRARAFASMAKLFCSDTAMSVTTDAVQLHGGYGYIKDYPVERMMRDAKVTQIWEGTNQIQQLLVAKYAFAAHERASR